MLTIPGMLDADDTRSSHSAGNMLPHEMLSHLYLVCGGHV